MGVLKVMLAPEMLSSRVVFYCLATAVEIRIIRICMLLLKSHAEKLIQSVIPIFRAANF